MSTIPISTFTIPDYHGGGSVAYLRIHANDDFVTSGLQPIVKSKVGAPDFYKQVPCTVSGTVITVPTFTLDSTTDSTDIDGTYTGIIHDTDYNRTKFLFKQWGVPHNLGSLSFLDLADWNLVPSTYVDANLNSAYTINQSNARYVAKSGDTMTGDLVVPEEVYGSGWNGSLEVPTKNALYDKIESLSGNGLGWLNSQDYGTVADAKRVDDGAITNGSHTLTSATAGFVLADVGKKVTVEGAGVAGAILSTTISGFTNSTTVTLTAAASTTVTGATTWFGTDDSAALNAAITAAYANGVALIYCPDGTYLFNGALLGTLGSSNAFSRIRFPANDAGVSGKWPAIKLLGAAPPPFTFGTGAPGISVLPNKGTVFVSTEDGGCVIGIEPTAGSFSLMRIEIENITIRTKNNPTQSGIDLRLASQFEIKNCQVDTGLYSVDCAQPTHTNAVGIYTPALNNGASTKLDTVSVIGYYDNYYLCEHGSGDNLYTTAGIHGFRFTSGIGHAQSYGRLVAHNCVYPMAFDEPVRLSIDAFICERAASTWQRTTAHIADTSGTGVGRPRGSIQFRITEVGRDPDLLSLIFDTPATVSGLAFTDLNNPGGGAILYATGTTQTITSGTPANIDWKVIDSNLTYASVVTWSSVTNPHQITVILPGKYHIRVATSYAANSTGQRTTYVAINGTAQISGPWFPPPASGDGIAIAEDTLHLQAGDIITAGALHTAGTAGVTTLGISDLGGAHTATRISISRVK